MNKSLSDITTDHFNQFKLSNEKIHRLQQLQNQIGGSDQAEASQSKLEKAPQSNLISMFTSKKLVAAASLFIGIMLATVVTMVSIDGFRQATTKDVLAQIAQEAVNNHQYLKPLEVSHDEFNSVAKYFDRLPFSPVRSEYVTSFNTLIGGRYCSVLGSPAAQFRMKDDAERVTTLFEVKYSKSRFEMVPNIDKGEVPAEQFIDGYQTKIWKEKGVVMVLVTPSSG